MISRMKKAGGGNPPATTVRRDQSYGAMDPTSRPNRLGRAAAVLLRLEGAAETVERQGLWRTFEAELEQAYGGLDHV